MRINWIWLFLFLTVCYVRGQDEVERIKISYTNEDVLIVDNYFNRIESKGTLSFNELIAETAGFFINTPYVASTLEKEEEHLVINLRELDCTTFVENVIALANTVEQENPTFELFCDELRRLRYRTEDISDYTDRLHYFSDWIYENEQKGLVRDITRQAGGEPYSLELSFMSTHPDNYPQLKGYPERIEEIRNIEQHVSTRDVYAMIPKGKINDCARNIKNGDIVCFVTSIKGLDVTHVGFAYWKDDVLGFIHASSSAKKVIVDQKSLQQYAENIKTTIGIMVIRPVGNS